MRKLLYPFIIVSVIVGIYFFENQKQAQTVSLKTEVFTQTNSQFDSRFLPESTSNEVVHHKYYSLSYIQNHLQAEWVCYRLHAQHLSNNSFKRPHFEIDKKVKGGSADWRNYKNSGYDRGHLCPAGDRRFSYEAYAETFLTSNASPQDPKFNAGVWNRLEIQIRNWVPQTGELLIITGGVLKDGLDTIGKDKVSIPEYYYKIVIGFDNQTPKAIGFLIPNQASNKSLSTFVTPIQHIEKLTSISFFKNVDSQMAHQLKSPVDYDFWKLK